MSTHPTSSTARPRLDLTRWGLGIVAAVAANLIVYAVGSAAGATWLANGQTVNWYVVIIATVVAMVVGGAVTWLVSRVWDRGIVVMAWVGLAFGVLTAPSPLLASPNAPTGWSLAAMHVLTAVAWFAAVRPRSGTTARGSE